MIEPGLYLGKVMHRRLSAPPHRFAYGSFWIAVDLDAPPKLRMFSVDRWNLFALLARDHADGRAGDLRAKIAARAEGMQARTQLASEATPSSRRVIEAEEACTPRPAKVRQAAALDRFASLANSEGGIEPKAHPALDLSGPMILLTMPRLFGFVFNPLSVYFCHDAAGAPSAIAWEVSNTFGARHTYILSIDPADDGVVRQACDKRLHVSPFLDMGLSYQFRVEASPDALKIGIVDRGPQGAVFAAALTATRRELTDVALLALALRAPLGTLKVVAAIHWEALQLWIKGARFRRAPPGSERPVADHAASLHVRAETKRRPMKAVREAAE